MLSDKMIKALNDQINLEMSSAYLYLGMAAHFDAESLPGIAAWMKAQFAEEQGHAFRLYEYVNDKGGKVDFGNIEAPPAKFGTPQEVFAQVLGHEQKVTASINNIYALAVEEKDFATQSKLNWFIDEQVEEEKTATDILEQLKRIEGHPHLLMMFDGKIMSMRGEG